MWLTSLFTTIQRPTWHQHPLGMPNLYLPISTRANWWEPTSPPPIWQTATWPLRPLKTLSSSLPISRVRASRERRVLKHAIWPKQSFRQRNGSMIAIICKHCVSLSLLCLCSRKTVVITFFKSASKRLILLLLFQALVSSSKLQVMSSRSINL